MVLMPALTQIIPAFPVAVPNVPPGLVIARTVERLAGDEPVPSPTPAASPLREPARQTATSAMP
jgi:hypothetical protein